MELKEKLAILADAAKYDASCASSGSRRKNLGGIGNTEGMGICHSYTPDGRCISLLKILLTNHCIFDCTYCVNRVSSDIPRARFSVEEVVNLTLEFYRRNYIEGLFLSSGVLRTPDETMEQMVEVARRLREDFKFGGYIHLKAVAGCSGDLLLTAGKWADRLSSNVEFSSQKELDQLAPAKDHAQIKAVMNGIAEKIAENREARKTNPMLRVIPEFAPGGQSTQMIVGATSASDKNILTAASGLYQIQKLRRVYYTAFSPIPNSDARLPSAAPPMVREHRLYQADWLLRFYKFTVDELVPESEPNLSLEHDPKMRWALRHPEFFPVDINIAPRASLLRIPGMGVRNVDRILKIRRFHRLTEADLVRLRVSLKRARHFLVARDWSPKADTPAPEIVRPMVQLSLFEAPALARTGEL